MLEAQRQEAESTIRSLELARDKANRYLGFTDRYILLAVRGTEADLLFGALNARATGSGF